MPWDATSDTKYIWSGHRACKGKVRTIIISEEKGIIALVSIVGGKGDVCSFGFAKSRWTLKQAQNWFRTRGLTKIHQDFQRIKNTFTSFKGYGGVIEGLEKYWAFITHNDFDQSKPYTKQFQLKERFEWVERELDFIKRDTKAEYYKAICLTSNISMNNNDYRDFIQMQNASQSLSYRPININHDHSRWLRYPDSRVEFVAANDFAIEGLLRISNREHTIQKQIRNGNIRHTSIEGRKNPLSIGGYHFTGLALLEKDRELPGDPLTTIEPIILAESMRKDIHDLVEGRVSLSYAALNNAQRQYEETRQDQPDEQNDYQVQLLQYQLAQEQFYTKQLWRILNTKGYFGTIKGKIVQGDPRRYRT